MPKQRFPYMAGNTKPIVFPLLDEDGNPIDLTGASAKFYAGPGPTMAVPNPVATFTKSSATSTVSIPQPMNGEIHVSMGKADTAAVLPGTELKIQIEVTYANGVEETLPISENTADPLEYYLVILHTLSDDGV